MRTQNGESVLARAVRIFEAFTPEESALTVSEISRRRGLHVATASRLVAELVSYGFLTRDADRRVRVGMRLWELATRASPSPSLRNAAMPFMEGVHDVVGHHVQLGVLDGDEVLFLERLTAPGAVVNYTRVAGRLPLHATSSGLVLLAHGPADSVRTELKAMEKAADQIRKQEAKDDRDRKRAERERKAAERKTEDGADGQKQPAPPGASATDAG
ncbi:IclR family transcriptional regulator [Streptomyces flaveus]|uniref:IclR family transcriptional regulator n=1 Tax=Streptomyces flaveus TaxID=66370 RepID=UPI00331B2C4D